VRPFVSGVDSGWGDQMGQSRLLSVADRAGGRFRLDPGIRNEPDKRLHCFFLLKRAIRMQGK